MLRRLNISLMTLIAMSAASRAAAVDPPVPPDAKFTDATKSSGVNFVHVNGAYGEKRLPETMGGGVAFLDYDNDGDQDLLFVQSGYWDGHVPPGAKPQAAVALYRNDGAGRLTDVSAACGFASVAQLYGTGV